MREVREKVTKTDRIFVLWNYFAFYDVNVAYLSFNEEVKL